jgi:TonB-linked SusC/RagA family outer membrane protein
MRKKLLSTVVLLVAFCQIQIFAQTSKVTGRVIGQDNNPVAGASVTIRGTNQGTVTDNDGNYSLTVPAGASLLVNSIGYTDQIVAIDGRSIINISLVAGNSAGLEEVVVTGYTAQKKKDIVGAVSVVDMTALKTVPTSSAVQGLQGQAAGVNVINSGSPGSASKIFVRGVTSLGNTDPLILVDGIQVPSLENISADDVESMQVLKDAGAAAVYGARGSNGVIIVTTKKGKSGRMQVNYDSWYNLQIPRGSNPFNMLSAEEYAREYTKINPATTLFKSNGEMYDYLFRGPGAVGRGGADEGDPRVDAANYNFDPQNGNNNYIIQKVNKGTTDMYKEVFRPALWMSHNISASGGNDRASYMMSLGYLDHQGTVMETWNKRYQLRVNSEYKITKDVKIGENLYGFGRTMNQLEQGGANGSFTSVATSRLWLPFLPVYDIEGNWGGTFAGPELGNWGNAVAEQHRTVNDRNRSLQLNGNVYIDATILNNFNFRSTFGGTINNYYAQDFSFVGYNNNEGFNGTNNLKEVSGFGTTAMWTNTLTYRKGFGKHGLTVLAGTESVENKGRQLQAQRYGFFRTDYNYLVLDNGQTNVSNTNNINNGAVYENALFSLIGKVDYNFEEKYLLSATVRRDGFSAFGANTRYGVFPSVAVGWRISQEEFMKKVMWINDLKLRASHGVLGNKENISPSNPFTLFGQGQRVSYYDIGGAGNSAIPGFYASTIGNPDTRWERNLLTNFGVDATLFNNSFDFSIEYYRKYIDGLLFQLPLAATVGEANRPFVNIGDIENKGFDISANYRRRVSKDLRFSIGANIGAYKMLIKKLPDPGYVYYGEQVRQEVGHPSSAFYGYIVEGIFSDAADVDKHASQPDGEPGRLKFKDVDGDGEITPDDKDFIGSPHPDFTYGINLGSTFRNFEFSAIFYGSQGNEIYNATKSAEFWGSGVGNKSRNILNAWTETNKNTSVPKAEPTRTFSTDGGNHSSYFIEDGSYFRLRSLTIGYNFPSSMLSNIGLNRVMVYVQGTNLFTITKYSGLDPELFASNPMFFGQDNANYPIQRGMVLGLKLGF